MTERELIEANTAQEQRRAETDAAIQRILDVLGDEASDDCGSLLRIERAVRRLKAERDRLRGVGEQMDAESDGIQDEKPRRMLRHAVGEGGRQ